jgi:hypothetical protein
MKKCLPYCGLLNKIAGTQLPLLVTRKRPSRSTASYSVFWCRMKIQLTVGYTLRNLPSKFMANKIRELRLYVLKFQFCASTLVVFIVILAIYRSLIV